MGEQARWNLSVSRELDLGVRTFLAERGGKKGDLSAFVERAVSDALFQEALREVHERNKDLDPDLLDAEIEAALAEVREENKAFWEARDWSAPYPS